MGTTLDEKFLDELQQVMSGLKDLKKALASQEPPAVELKAIEAQKKKLQDIKRGTDGIQHTVNRCRQSGSHLLRPSFEMKRHMEELDNAWDSITSMYAKKERNLLDACRRLKAMEFDDMLQKLLEFLAKSENKFDNFGAIGVDIATVKKQIEDLKILKDEVDPWTEKVEAFKR